MNKITLLVSTLVLSGTTVSMAQKKSMKKNDEVLNTSFISKTVKPGDNFFMYANGDWYDTAKISATETGVGSFYDLAKSVRENIKVILENVEKTKSVKGSTDQLVGDFYASGMDTLTINSLGYSPIKPRLAHLDKVSSITELMQFIALKEHEGGSSFISWGIGADDKNSSEYIVQFGQGGIGLSDKDYYWQLHTTWDKVNQKISGS